MNSKMDRRIVNPWTWQDAQGWPWGVEVTRPERTLYCAGQVPTAADGSVVHAGDMPKQIDAALDNLERVLAEAGYRLGDVVRIDYYTTVQAIASR